jgi:hypothetical protein
MREERDISIQHAETGNEAVGAVEDLGGHFTARTAVLKEVVVPNGPVGGTPNSAWPLPGLLSHVCQLKLS